MAEKKKILYIVEAMGGGVFTYIVELANALADTYDMYIAYAVREQTPKDYKSYFDKRVHLIHVKNFRRAVSPAADVRAFFEIRRIAAQIRPDVIHLHSSKAGALGRLAFNGNKVPLFYTPHGYSFLMQNTSAVKRSLYRGIEVLCGLRPCTTISCSVGENTEAKRIARRAVCVDNGIDIPELQAMLAKEPAPQPHPFTVFTLGRICYQKNPAQFNRIAQAMPDVRFLWIGDGEEAAACGRWPRPRHAGKLRAGVWSGGTGCLHWQPHRCAEFLCCCDGVRPFQPSGGAADRTARGDEL